MTQTDPYFKSVTKRGTSRVLQGVLLGYRKESNRSLPWLQQTYRRIDQDLRSQKNENYERPAVSRNETNYSMEPLSNWVNTKVKRRRKYWKGTSDYWNWKSNSLKSLFLWHIKCLTETESLSLYIYMHAYILTFLSVYIYFYIQNLRGACNGS